MRHGVELTHLALPPVVGRGAIGRFQAGIVTQLVCVGLDRGDIPTRQGGVYEAAPRGLDRVSPSTEPRQKSTHKDQGATL